MEEKATTVLTIGTEVTQPDYDDLINFIYRGYILPGAQHFTNIVKNVSEGQYLLYFTLVDTEKKWYVDVQMRIEQPIQVKMVLSNREVPEQALHWLRSILVTAVRAFEEQHRKTTLYFAWVEGEEIIPERIQEARKNIVYRMFSESMLLLFIVFTMLSFLLFIILQPYAPIMLVMLQFIIILSSDKIIGRMGDWSITHRTPLIHIFQYRMPVSDYKSFLSKYGREVFSKIKNEVYGKTLATGKPIDYEACSEALSKYGLGCTEKNTSAKTINIYEIVKEVAGRFKLPIPKITVSNTILPNAAASGPWPSRGVVLITTGLIVQLDEKELLSVFGHEFSHLKGRDPLILFLLTSLEYLLRFYVFWPILYIIGYLYLFLALGVVYFIAKFFESKADLESAIRIGEPKTLANALRKMGFRRLQLEMARGYAFQEWIGWDPHPPVYFRIARLEKLKEPSKIKHPLMQSIKDNIRGFLEIIK